MKQVTNCCRCRLHLFLGSASSPSPAPLHHAGPRCITVPGRMAVVFGMAAFGKVGHFVSVIFVGVRLRCFIIKLTEQNKLRRR